MDKKILLQRTWWVLGYLVPTLFVLLNAADQFEVTQNNKDAVIADVKSEFEGLPKNGYAVITAIRNMTNWNAGLEFEKTIHDELPIDTVAAFKHKASGKYLAARQVVLGGKKQWVIRPDADTTDDKAAQFVVDRRISSVPKLKDWIGFASLPASENTMQATDDGTIGFADQAFMDDTSDRKAHWEILGTTINDCYLSNRLGGMLTFYKGTKTVETGREDIINVEKATWGLEQKDSFIRYGDVITIQSCNSSWVGAMANPADPASIQLRQFPIASSSDDMLKGSLSIPDQCKFRIVAPGGKADGSLVCHGENIILQSLVSNNAPVCLNSNNDLEIGCPWLGKIGRKTITNLNDDICHFKIMFEVDTPRPREVAPTKMPIKYGNVVIFHPLWNAAKHKDRYWEAGDCSAGWPGNPINGDGLIAQKDLRHANFRRWKKFKIYDQDGTFPVVHESSVRARQADGSWQAVGDANLVDVAVRNDNEAWGLSADYRVWQWDGSSWKNIPTAQNFVNIAVSSAGDVFAISDEGKLWERKGDGWEQKTVATPRGLRPAIKWMVSKGEGEKFETVKDPAWVFPDSKSILYFQMLLQRDALFKFGNYYVECCARNRRGDNTFSNSMSEGQIGDKYAWEYCPVPSSSDPIQVAVAPSGANDGLLTIYLNGKRAAHNWYGNFSLSQAPYQFSSRDVQVSYGDFVVEPIPPTNLEEFFYLRKRTNSLAVQTKQIVWYIGQDGALYKTDCDQKNVKQAALGDSNVTGVACSDDGSVWAIVGWRQLWHLVDNKTWQMVNPPAEKPYFTSLAVRTDKEVYFTSLDGTPFLWNGSSWQKLDQKLKRIAVGSGITHKIIVHTEQVDVQQMMTKSPVDGKPFEPSPDAKLDIEILELGMKGNIKPQATIDMELPAQQNPTVTGFAQTKLDLKAGAEMTVQPLKSKGAAWPERAFSTANRGTVAFMAQPQDAGDIQVVFGSQISDSYLFKVIIGGQKNSRASIIRRSIDDSDDSPTGYIDQEVFGLDVKENNLAYATPGTYTPYWATYDNGLIMVGMGQPGNNVFMAYRTDNPPALVNRVGFCSNSKPVKYADIQMLDPVVPMNISRLYATAESEQSLSPAPGSISWSTMPFRVPGNGTVSFEVKGTEQVVLALGTNTKGQPSYLITFGEGNNEGLSLKRWNEAKKTYTRLALMPNKGYKGLDLKPDDWNKVWVSFDDGVFVIGTGDVVNANEDPNFYPNAAFVYQDIAYPERIQFTGFGAFGKDGASIRNLSIAPPVTLGVAIPLEDYDQIATKSAPYQGPITVILPFDYKIYQVGASLKVDDHINSQSYFIAGMPQQGALYYFMGLIKDDGFLQMAPSKDPDNPLQVAINREIVTTAASADLARAKTDILSKQSDLIKALAVAQGDKDRAAAQGMFQAANVAVSAGTGIASAGAFSQSPAIALTAIGMGSAIAAGGIAVASSAAARMADAASKDLDGAKAAAVVQRQTLNNQMQAEELNFRAKLLSGNAQFAFKSAKAYVYVDAPQRPALGDAQVPPDAIANRKKVTDIMTATSMIPLNSQQGFERLLSMLQDVEYMVTHYYVMEDFSKKKFIDKMEELFNAFPALYGTDLNVRIINNLINLLLTAINNGYLVNAQTDAAKRELWYSWINKLAQLILLQTKSIRLNACYGEYIWLPFDISGQDDLTVTFEAEGQHDVFVGFAQEPDRMRNTNKEMYEVCIGGWNNTKTAIRLQSLGDSVATFNKKDFPQAMLNTYKRQRYTVSYKDGIISVQPEGGKPIAWKDPYPLTGLKWIGLSTWDVPISFSNITVTSGKGNVQAADADRTEGMLLEKGQRRVDQQRQGEQAIQKARSKTKKSGTKKSAGAGNPVVQANDDTSTPALQPREDIRNKSLKVGKSGATRKAARPAAPPPPAQNDTTPDDEQDAQEPELTEEQMRMIIAQIRAEDAAAARATGKQAAKRAISRSEIRKRARRKKPAIRRAVGTRKSPAAKKAAAKGLLAGRPQQPASQGTVPARMTQQAPAPAMATRAVRPTPPPPPVDVAEQQDDFAAQDGQNLEA